jgi:uncharacterized protein
MGTEKSTELLGAPKQANDRDADPLATRVLSRGEAIVAPHGRADDFSWPHADTGAVEPASDPARLKGSAGTTEAGDGNKPKSIKSGESKDAPPALRATVRPAPAR